MADLSFMIGRWSFDSQHEESDWHPTNAGYTYFSYTKEYQSNNASERHQRKNGLKKTTKM